MSQTSRIQKHTKLLILIVIGMFGFCFALIPLYSVFCKATGLNGKTSNQAKPLLNYVDKSRKVVVELVAIPHQELKGEFVARHKKFTLHPGEYVTTSYWVKNLTANDVVFQAIPSVTPGLGARYINKIECFCFQKQPLAKMEGKEMPLVFTVDPALPHSVDTLTLAYTLFDVSSKETA